MNRNLHGPLKLALATILCMAGADVPAQSSGPENLFAQDIISNRVARPTPGTGRMASIAIWEGAVRADSSAMEKEFLSSQRVDSWWCPLENHALLIARTDQ